LEPDELPKVELMELAAMAVPTPPVAGATTVTVGEALLTVSVKFPALLVPYELVAETVKLDEPATLGVPERAPVLDVKVTPEGSVPDSV
jgi:hypothetical protein